MNIAENEQVISSDSDNNLPSDSFADNASFSRRSSNSTSRKSSLASSTDEANATVLGAKDSLKQYNIDSRKSSINTIRPVPIKHLEMSYRAPSNYSRRISTSRDEVANRIALDLMEIMNNKTQNPSMYTQSIYSTAADAQKLSDIETLILRANEPTVFNESDEIEVLGQRGIWLNKQEVINWRGLLPISEYKINEDANPEVITKRSLQKLEYIQELAVRYLRPPTPPAPGEIVITQERNILTQPAPPLIIRQQPARPKTPEPLVIREAPPLPPTKIGRKLITISGKRLPPPPRKVVIERFAELPAKPQSVLIERWLPYSEVKRRVIFKAAPPDPIVVKPRNMIIQWEAPRVSIIRDLKYLGVIRANPVEYVRAYGINLRVARDLPDFVHEIKAPSEVGLLASEYTPLEFHELEGDLHALNLVNLDKEGLGAYKKYLNKSDNYLNRTYTAADRSLKSGLKSAFSISDTSSNIGTVLASAPSTPFIPNLTKTQSIQEYTNRSPSVYAAAVTEPSVVSNSNPSDPTEPSSNSTNLLNTAFDENTPSSKSSSRKSSLKSSTRKSSLASVHEPEPEPEPQTTATTMLSVESRPESSRNVSFEQPKLSETASGVENSSLNDLIGQIFQAIDTNNTGTISVAEAEKTLLRLNTRLSKNYGENDIKSFFEFLDVNQNGLLTFEEFKRAFLNIAQ
jgi:hypothetical protein